MQPFEQHPANAGELTDLGGRLRGNAAETSETSNLTRTAYQPAIASWSGLASLELRQAPRPLTTDADRAGRALAWAGLAAEYWAGEVGAFNRAVENILATDGQGPHWGATGVDGEPPSEEAILAARHAAEQRWHRAHETHILDGADQVVAMLRDGPTDEHLAELARAGLLPQLGSGAGTGADWYQFALAGTGLGGLPLAQYDPEALARRLELLRDLGYHPSEYADLLQMYWVSVAADNAGIDLSRWDPSLGAAALSDIIPAVYRYYGDLYLENPYLQWAGMANMIGPTFAAGFFDLSSMRRIANGVGRFAPILPADIPALDNLAGAELRFFETTFLQMHQDIFFDQAMMHEAYLDGGLAAIEELREAGLIDIQTEQAWGQIDEGRHTLDRLSNPGSFSEFMERAEAMHQIEQGNTQLLLREQRDIIDGHYQEMRDRPGTGDAFTYMLGAIGESSIPGSQSFADYSPLEVELEVPVEVLGVEVGSVGAGSVETPFPEGNLANFEDRWDFISNDTLPAYQQLLREDPELAREIIASDPSERIDEYRLHNRVDSILEQLTDWDYDAYLEVELGPVGGRVG